jgi:alkyl hydroperoxide reductase subunit AhpC
VATLMLASRNAPVRTEHASTSLSLRTWLREGWTILFSHPDDFVRYDLEIDRWLVVVQRAFAERRVRPLALASSTQDVERSWISQISGDTRTLLLDDLSRQGSSAVDLQSHALRAEIAVPGRRFVMIIDSELRTRRTFSYSSLSDLPSPLEFPGWAATLRAKQAADTSARSAFVADARERQFYSARRHKHWHPGLACSPTLHAARAS